MTQKYYDIREDYILRRGGDPSYSDEWNYLHHKIDPFESSWIGGVHLFYPDVKSPRVVQWQIEQQARPKPYKSIIAFRPPPRPKE